MDWVSCNNGINRRRLERIKVTSTFTIPIKKAVISPPEHHFRTWLKPQKFHQKGKKKRKRKKQPKQESLPNSGCHDSRVFSVVGSASKCSPCCGAEHAPSMTITAFYTDVIKLAFSQSNSGPLPPYSVVFCEFRQAQVQSVARHMSLNTLRHRLQARNVVHRHLSMDEERSGWHFMPIFQSCF